MNNLKISILNSMSKLSKENNVVEPGFGETEPNLDFVRYESTHGEKEFPIEKDTDEEIAMIFGELEKQTAILLDTQQYPEIPTEIQDEIMQICTASLTSLDLTSIQKIISKIETLHSTLDTRKIRKKIRSGLSVEKNVDFEKLQKAVVSIRSSFKMLKTIRTNGKYHEKVQNRLMIIFDDLLNCFNQEKLSTIKNLAQIIKEIVVANDQACTCDQKLEQSVWPGLNVDEQSSIFLLEDRSENLPSHRTFIFLTLAEFFQKKISFREVVDKINQKLATIKDKAEKEIHQMGFPSAFKLIKSGAAYLAKTSEGIYQYENMAPEEPNLQNKMYALLSSGEIGTTHLLNQINALLKEHGIINEEDVLRENLRPFRTDPSSACYCVPYFDETTGCFQYRPENFIEMGERIVKSKKQK